MAFKGELVVLMVSISINGALALYSFELAADNRVAAEKTKKLEADVRTQVGKVYNLEEKQQDELEAARGEGAVELWKTKEALEQCEKGKK